MSQPIKKLHPVFVEMAMDMIDAEIVSIVMRADEHNLRPMQRAALAEATRRGLLFDAAP